ncbi:Unknown protein, partial [Striga hermonthica]
HASELDDHHAFGTSLGVGKCQDQSPSFLEHSVQGVGEGRLFQTLLGVGRWLKKSMPPGWTTTMLLAHPLGWESVKTKALHFWNIPFKGWAKVDCFERSLGWAGGQKNPCLRAGRPPCFWYILGVGKCQDQSPSFLEHPVQGVGEGHLFRTLPEVGRWSKKSMPPSWMTTMLLAQPLGWARVKTKALRFWNIPFKGWAKVAFFENSLG